MNTLSPNSDQNRIEQLKDYEPTRADELRALEQLWESNRLEQHLRSLEAFYQKNRDRLQRVLEANPSSAQLVEVAKLLVVENTIVDRISETKDQIKEIESEIWIQGEQGNHDRERIACEWATHHAAAWRQWRIKEYLFATSRMGNRLERCIA